MYYHILLYNMFNDILIFYVDSKDVEILGSIVYE